MKKAQLYMNWALDIFDLTLLFSLDQLSSALSFSF
jgi:hypothetical protein